MRLHPNPHPRASSLRLLEILVHIPSSSAAASRPVWCTWCFIIHFPDIDVPAFALLNMIDEMLESYRRR